jgi:acyl carrier protein
MTPKGILIATMGRDSPAEGGLLRLRWTPDAVTGEHQALLRPRPCPPSVPNPGCERRSGPVAAHSDTPERTVVPAETHVEQTPLDREGVLNLIRDRLADILEVEPSSINEGDSFADDLDADSLALIELVEALEEELGERSVGFRIEDEDLEDLKTVRDAVDYVVAKLG